MSFMNHDEPETTTPATGATTLRGHKTKVKRIQLNNPLQLAISNFLAEASSKNNEIVERCKVLHQNVSSIPKRYTLYPPLLLLPSNFLPSPTRRINHAEDDGQWYSLVSGLDSHSLDTLWQHIIQTFRKDGITHIAIGAPIELEVSFCGDSTPSRENILRSPTGLTGVYGDFGLVPSARTSDGDGSFDFDSALWVESVQNGGIAQVWAPMWTMFSRGNIKEKARVLSGVPPSPLPSAAQMAASTAQPVFDGLDGPDGVLGQPLSSIAVVDMYVGIGYFAFSYLKRGVGRVFGFELNPWSVEGLRRGAEKNGWSCKIVRLPSFPENSKESIYSEMPGSDVTNKLQQCLQDEELRLVILEGDNRWSTTIIPYLQSLTQGHQHTAPSMQTGTTTVPSPSANPPSWQSIRHINLGLLPTSSQAYSSAEQLLCPTRGGWIHVHENVQVEKIEDMARDIETQFRDYVLRRKMKDFTLRRRLEVEDPGKDEDEGSGKGWRVKCVHVERVKSFAPGIWHCVFDVWIHRPEQERRV